MQDGVKNYESGVVTSICSNCKQTFSEDISEYSPKFLEEFGEYENLYMRCMCGTIMVINVNIPIHDEEEIEVMEVLAPLHEVNARRFVRKLMWEKRSDLRTKDREKERIEHFKMHEDKINKDRADAAKERERSRGVQRS